MYLFKGGIQASFAAFLLPAVICGAAACVFFDAPGLVSRIVPVLLFGCAVGLFAGWGITAVQEIRSTWFGLETENIAAFEGYLLEDGYEIRSGTVRYRLDLRAVMDTNGWEADASGEVIVYCEEQRPKAWGTRLFITAPLITRVHDGREFSTCRTGQEQLRQTGWVSPLLAFRESLRSALIRRVRSIGDRSGPLLEALLLGVRDDLTLFEESLFRKAGCMHILALSGMHLGILAGILYIFLGFLFPRTITSVAVVAVLLFYLFIAGFRPSLVRGVLMIVLIWFGSVSGRRSRSIVLLLEAFILQVLLFPLSGHTLSFQLSFLALGGIFLFSPPVARRFAGILPGWIRHPLAAAVGAQAATGILVLYRFRVLYPIGILASLLLTPLITLFMWVGLLSLLPVDLQFLQSCLHRLADMLYHGIMLAASWSAGVPGIELGQPVPLLLYGLMLVLLLAGPFVSGRRAG